MRIDATPATASTVVASPVTGSRSPGADGSPHRDGPTGGVVPEGGVGCGEGAGVGSGEGDAVGLGVGVTGAVTGVTRWVHPHGSDTDSPIPAPGGPGGTWQAQHPPIGGCRIAAKVNATGVTGST